MPVPMPERDFEALVKANGYTVVPTSKHMEILDKDGNRLMTYAVRHKKGGKREIKPIYVKLFKSLAGI